MNNDEFFHDLTAKRERFSNDAEDNEFDLRGWLTKLYPNTAHFIYELLQNAEDANAKRVEFCLSDDSLVFVHDGNRLFGQSDVKSITSIGNSTKSNDTGKIGKFGIGFKSVFSYTDTPIIHSGDWHFKICNLVVPKLTAECRSLWEVDKEKTVFKFPFNCQGKLPQKAYAEILHELQCMDVETILFLHNIQEVYISYEGRERIITRTVDYDSHLISLRRIDEKNEVCERQYLKFERVVRNFRTEDECRIIPELPVSIAFKLGKKELGNDQEKRLSDCFEIVPVADRNVFVYFPAEKEFSGLRFCIQAPFATTAARDSVQNSVDNGRIVFELVELFESCFDYLKYAGLLSTEFLGVLPNSKDVVTEMYVGLRQSIQKLFCEKQYTPTRNGGHASANKLCCGDSELVKIIEDDDLGKLCGDGVKWVKNASQKNQNADRFLDDLKIHKYELSEFIEKIKYNKDLARDILKTKDVCQLRTLYVELDKYLQKLADSYSERERGCRIVEALKKMPIIRVEDGSLVCPNDGVYLARQYMNSGNGESVQFVHPEMLGEKLPSNQKDSLTHFFAKLGIVVYDEAASMKLFIDNYWNKLPNLPDDDCVLQLSQLINLVARRVIKSEIARRFPVKDSDGTYVEISKTYIDNPYKETGLSCMKSMLQANNRRLLNSYYYDALGESDVKSLLDHLADYDILSELKVCDSPICRNPQYSQLLSFRSRTAYACVYDYDIPGLDSCVRELDQQQGEMIWSLVLRERNKLEAFYSANSRDSGRHAPSKYICTLKDAEWIVCKDGKRRKPCDVTFENLPDGWIVPHDGYHDVVLMAIGFGCATETQREEQEKKDQVFKASGFDSAKEVDELKEIKKTCEECGLDPNEALSQLKAKVARAALPKECANDVERRKRVVASDYEKAPEQKYVVVGRTVHVENAKIRDDARTYLREKYGRDGKMFCQLCQESMPFNGRDGNGYFEATQVFMRMKKDIKEQFISLCPICRAKYDEWVRRSRDRSKAFKDAILRREPQLGEGSVEILLPGESENGIKSPLSGKSIYFTGTHFVDLRQAVLENEKLGGLDDFSEQESVTAGPSAS